MSDNEQNSAQETPVQVEVEEKSCNCKAAAKTCPCKKIARIFGGIAAVIIAAVMLLLIFRDTFIPTTVSKIGTLALGTKVEIKKFSSSLTGKVDIQGLSVANPEGYKNPNAFVLDHVYVDVSILSLLSSEIVIREILVTGMQVDLEAKLNRTNLGELKANVEKLAPQKDTSKADKQEEPADTDNASQKSVVIEKLNINNNFISLSNSAIGITTRIPLVPINMENVGQGQTVAETFNEIFIRILSSVFDACKNVGGKLGNSIQSATSTLSNSASAIGKGLTDTTKGIGKSFSDTTGNLFKGLKK